MENFENTYVYYYTPFRFQFLLVHIIMLIFLLPSDENFSWELLEFLIVFDSLKFHSNVSWWTFLSLIWHTVGPCLFLRNLSLLFLKIFVFTEYLKSLIFLTLFVFLRLF